MPFTPVMGPVPNTVKSLSPTDPPFFNASANLQEWRRDVCLCVEIISVAAYRGTDRLYQTVYATLAHQIYDRCLPSEQKSIVDEAQAKGLIDYKQDVQVAAVRDIIELIAIDPPIAVVSRLISSFNKVTACRRRSSEDLGRFVSVENSKCASVVERGGDQ